MQILKPTLQLELFFDWVESAQQRVLLLDYDGTLAPFRAERDQATPYLAIPSYLDALAEHTRVVIVSGRAVRDVQRLLTTKHPLEIWGSHGWERLTTQGHYAIGTHSARAAMGLIAARDLLLRLDLHPHIEEKPAGVALHWRGLPATQVAWLRSAVGAELADVAQAYRLDVHPFDGGLEVRLPGRTKGFAVQALLADVTMNAAIAYLGDDRTDEDAFEALGTRGLSVLVRPELRLTAAQLWLRPPDDLYWFLDKWHTAACQLEVKRDH